MSTETHVIINPLDFDPSRLVVAPATFSTFKKKNQEFMNCSSEVLYETGPIGSNRTKKIYIQAPTQTVFGFSEQYEIGKDPSPETFRGYQVVYPVSANTVPTDSEAAFIKMLDHIHAAVVEAGKREVANHDQLEAAGKVSKFPENVISSYLNITRSGKNDTTKFIKPLSEFPNVKDTKNKDTTKPKRMYISLVSNNKDNQVLTRLMSKTRKSLSVKDYISSPGNVKRGNLTPLFEIKNVYWGSHGTKPQGGSVKIQLVQGIYVPLSSGPSVPTTLLISLPEGFSEEGEGEGEGDEEGEGEGNSQTEDLPGEASVQFKPNMNLEDAMASIAAKTATPAVLERPSPASVVSEVKPAAKRGSKKA